MFPLLFYLPVLVSLVLGIGYVAFGESRPAAKVAVIAIFGIAAALQFLTRHALAGMLLQIALALFLAVWRKLSALR